jgi:hypothetical protein
MKFTFPIIGLLARTGSALVLVACIVAASPISYVGNLDPN